MEFKNLLRLIPFQKKKRILGGGLSYNNHCIRFAFTHLEGKKIRILRLFEVEHAGFENPMALKKKLQNLNLSSTSFAMNLADPSLKIKNITLPVMPSHDLNQAIYWNLVEDEVELSELEVRSIARTSNKKTNSPSKDYQVYGISTRIITQAKNWAEELNLDIRVGEPAAVALASLYQWLEPASNKSTAIFHLEDGIGHCIGIKNTTFDYWKTFRISSFEQGIHDASLAMDFQEGMNNALHENHLSHVDEIILTGEFNSSDSELIHQSTGVHCIHINDKLGAQLLLSDEKQKEKIGRYAVALGLSTYPTELL